MQKNLLGDEFTPPEKKEWITTPNGHNRFYVTSALIKALRRGHEEAALYWAFELETQSVHLWKRLVIFSMEDIGLADPDCVVRVMAMYTAYTTALAKDQLGGGRLAVTQAVLDMCRAKKNRLVDWTIATHMQKRAAGMKLEIPDHAYDNHTYEGKRRGRGPDYFADNSALENNTVELPPLVRAGSREETDIKLDRTTLDLLEEWRAGAKVKKSHPYDA